MDCTTTKAVENGSRGTEQLAAACTGLSPITYQSHDPEGRWSRRRLHLLRLLASFEHHRATPAEVAAADALSSALERVDDMEIRYDRHLGAFELRERHLKERAAELEAALHMVLAKPVAEVRIEDLNAARELVGLPALQEPATADA